MNHLKEVEENYFVHGFFALTYSARLLWLSIAALLHAIFPHILACTTSRGIDRLTEDIESRRGREISPGVTD